MDGITMDVNRPMPHIRRMRPAWDPEKRKQIGRHIHWARELVVPNRSEFARDVRVDVSAIRRIENGTKGPSIELLQRICHTLKISSDYVLDGKLVGVNPELAQMLIERHPELLRAQPDTAGKVSMVGIARQPRKQLPSSFRSARA